MSWLKIIFNTGVLLGEEKWEINSYWSIYSSNVEHMTVNLINQLRDWHIWSAWRADEKQSRALLSSWQELSSHWVYTSQETQLEHHSLWIMSWGCGRILAKCHYQNINRDWPRLIILHADTLLWALWAEAELAHGSRLLPTALYCITLLCPIHTCTHSKVMAHDNRLTTSM